jgi:monoamine oxidase
MAVDRNVTRRRFVSGTLATGAAAAAPGIADARAKQHRRATAPSTRKTDVAIIGAGFAGLTAARNLVAEGRSVNDVYVADGQRSTYSDTGITGTAPLDPTGLFETSWSGQEWTRGCPVGIPAVGALLAYGSWLRAPIGRIHWAGTETPAYWNGYMDGAVRSGERAAAEVLAAL